MKTAFLLFYLASLSLAKAELPVQPTVAADPGSAVYSHELYHESLSLGGRTAELFAPKDFQNSKKKITLVVFGHGQAIPVSSYQASFEHLAKKGVAVLFPGYDTGFFDQDWRRMAADYVNQLTLTIQKYPNAFDPEHVIFAGHSKGAYVTVVAAGLPSDQLTTKPASIVLFDPAGYDADYIQKIDSRIPVTLTWADHDTIVKESLVHEIYDKLPSQKKQLIQVRSYSELQADHFFSLTKKFAFGGRDGVTPFHFYGTWKWLLGAAWDLETGALVNNSYLYGALSASTGITNQEHQILRSW